MKHSKRNTILLLDYFDKENADEPFTFESRPEPSCVRRVGRVCTQTLALLVCRVHTSKRARVCVVCVQEQTYEHSLRSCARVFTRSCTQRCLLGRLSTTKSSVFGEGGFTKVCGANWEFESAIIS